MKTYKLVDRVPVECPMNETVFGPDRQVAATEIGDVSVSTVFLGIDHSFGAAGPPILFETMVFGPGTQFEIRERCCTWEEAEEQHKRIVLRVKRLLLQQLQESIVEQPFLERKIIKEKEIEIPASKNVVIPIVQKS